MIPLSKMDQRTQWRIKNGLANAGHADSVDVRGERLPPVKWVQSDRRIRVGGNQSKRWYTTNADAPDGAAFIREARSRKMRLVSADKLMD